ncbi:hypothetical protein BKG95_09215 [Rodentibacter pneumotropicus]|uniref:Uncharacterized protein n=1 Tax=Rodentibacter pneumotropicus TaxID=758 RepID=A0AAW5L976_9PAST|nr:hypothetical protein [Rodentibacter pneumotropicus]MCQ9120394.1 hypothetical protein [Rodentibacter pneumotropicus]OOF66861.1 hypothetical protein BKG95_09215 [Rodentibacter pneumotropicus]
MKKFLPILGFVITVIVGGIGIYSSTIESYAKRNSNIYSQARILKEQAMDMLYSGMTERYTIEPVELDKLDVLLMEKPFLTKIPNSSYKETEDYYRGVSAKLKELIEKNNEYILLKNKDGIDIKLDNSDSLSIKMELINLTDDLIKHSEKFK